MALIVTAYPISAELDTVTGPLETLVVTKILLDTHGQMKKELNIVVNLHNQRVKLISRMKKIYGNFLKKELSKIVPKWKPHVPKKEKAPKKETAPKKEKAKKKTQKLVKVIGKPIETPEKPTCFTAIENDIIVVYPIDVNDEIKVIGKPIETPKNLPENFIVNNVVVAYPAKVKMIVDGCEFEKTCHLDLDDMDADTVIDEDLSQMCSDVFGDEDETISPEIRNTVYDLIEKIVENECKVHDYYLETGILTPESTDYVPRGTVMVRRVASKKLPELNSDEFNIDDFNKL